MLAQPFFDLEKEVLLAPQHSGQCLSHDISGVFANSGGDYRAIKGVGFMPARVEDFRKPGAERLRGTRSGIAEPQPDDGSPAGGYPQPIMRGSLGAGVAGVDRTLPVGDDA